MKTDFLKTTRLYLRMYAAILAVFLIPGFGLAQDKPIEKAAPKGEKIEISADRLVAAQNNQMVVFSGNVKAVHGKINISSDTLNVFYTDPKKSSDKRYNKDSIERIVASGNVTIEMEGKTATCDQAVYQTATKTMTLTGEKTRIQSGENYITGKTVTLYQDTGQIVVDGNENKRVNAVFLPEDKTMTTDFK